MSEFLIKWQMIPTLCYFLQIHTCYYDSINSINPVTLNDDVWVRSMYLGRGQVITSHRIRGMSLDTRNRHRSSQINRLSVKSTYPMYFVPNILHSVLWIEILHSFENLSAIHSCHINSKRPISLKHITLITFTSIHDFISTVRALLSDCIKTYSNDDSDKNNYWKKITVITN